MIHTREQYEVQSNIGAEKVAMTIDESSMAHIMGVLTNLYSNKRGAIIREYTTNAYDAQVEAGVTRPIEVTLPTPLSPFFKVKDFGVGLTVEDIHTIYSQYGASTKRGSNAQNGMLGLGCKSALTYCSQFTVSSVKDGTKIVVNVGRDEDGGGSMTVVDTRSTTEGNGTEVVIPVNRGDERVLTDEAASFFAIWKPGTVLVNGVEPAHFLTREPLKLTDDIYLDDIYLDQGHMRVSQVVMGNVAYPAPALDSLVPGTHVLAFVPIGAVNFPPSREALMDTKTTRATIEKIKADFFTAVQGAVQREVTASATPADALRVVIKWSRTIRGSAIQADQYDYKGTKLPASFEVPGIDPNKPMYDASQPSLLVSTASGYQRKGYAVGQRSISVTEWPGVIWVTDFKPAKFNASHKNKLLKWTEDAGISLGARDGGVEKYVMCPGRGPSSPFIDKSRIVSWDVVRKIQLQPRASYNGTTRLAGSYDIVTEDGAKQGVAGDTIRQSLPVVWVDGNRYAADFITGVIKAIYPQFTIVALPANRVEKFKRNVPTAIASYNAIKDGYKAWVAKLTPDQKNALALTDLGVGSYYRALDAKRVDDPALKEGARLARLDVTALVRERRDFQGHCNGVVLGGSFTNTLSQDYPLFHGGALTRNPDHVYMYLNAAFAAKK